MGKKRFMGEVEGMGTTHASRLGNAQSGIRSHTRGWNLGVKVHGDPAFGTDKDRFIVEITGGSHNASTTRRIFEVYETEDGKIKVEYNGDIYEVFNRELKPV